MVNGWQAKGKNWQVSSETTKLLHATQKVINNKSRVKHLDHANLKKKTKHSW